MDIIKEPDTYATPEQHAILDRAVTILERTFDQNIPLTMEEDIAWLEIIKELHVTTPGLYGCDFIHQGWHLMLHGPKFFAQRITEESIRQTDEFFERIHQQAEAKRLNQSRLSNPEQADPNAS
jgi:hypothetical protein